MGSNPGPLASEATTLARALDFTVAGYLFALINGTKAFAGVERF